MRYRATAQSVGLLVWCLSGAAFSEASATPRERVEFEGATQRLLSGASVPGDRIQADLAKPDGPGPFPAIVGLHGCAGMHETTKHGFINALVNRGYVVLLVDSYATRAIDHACTSTAFATFAKRRPDAYGSLVFLARQTFVDPQRIAAVGFSAGAWVSLSVAEADAHGSFVLPNNLKFRATAAFYPPCNQAGARPSIPTIIFIGALDEWTPAADCSWKLASWGSEGAPIDLRVYAGAYHGFYYPHLQPGMRMFGHWLEYNEGVSDDARSRLLQFLDRNLK